jgi:energy-converting hydrogenase B subunit D
MTTFWVIDLACLTVILVCACLVVFFENLNASVMALSGVGTVLSLLFVVLHAPDVAHSEVVVGAIALPVLYLLAIGKTRAHVGDRPELGELGEVRTVAEAAPAPDDAREPA